jgi:hypothetical protein
MVLPSLLTTTIRPPPMPQPPAAQPPTVLQENLMLNAVTSVSMIILDVSVNL